MSDRKKPVADRRKPVSNGNGALHESNGAAIKPKNNSEKEENIFVFIPNLIGKAQHLIHVAARIATDQVSRI